MRVKTKEDLHRGKNFFIVTSRDQLPELTNTRGFLENPLAQGEWKLKMQTGANVIGIEPESLKSFVTRLSAHDVVLISGPQLVGKSTFLLYFVDKCLGGEMGPWNVFVFIDPDFAPEDLDSVLGEVQDRLTDERYESRRIVFALDGPKRISDNDKNFIDRSFRLFRWTSKRGYKLLVTLREDQTSTLQEIYSKRGREGKCSFDLQNLDCQPLEREKRFESVKKLLVGYLTSGLYSGKIPHPTFNSPEFNDCVGMIKEKSDGLIGYIAFLLEDLSVNHLSFSSKTVSRYPKGMTSLIWSTIKRDYFVEGDKSLPLLLTFLTRQQFPVTEEFVKSLTKWAIQGLNEQTSIDKEAIFGKMRNLLVFYAEKSHLELEQGIVEQYSLKNLVREAIEDGLSRSHEMNDFDEILKAFSDIARRFESLVSVEYLRKFQQDLATRDLSEWRDPYVLGDIARIWGIKGMKVGARVVCLEYAINSFLENNRNDFQTSTAWNFLKTAIIFTLRKAAEAIPAQNCDLAIRFLRSVHLDTEDAWTRWVLGTLIEKKGLDAEAIDWYVESKNIENTSKGYGSLIKKLDLMMERAPEETQIDYLDLREALVIKAIECYAGEHRNWIDLSRVLNQKADFFIKAGEFWKARKSLDFAQAAYERAMKVNARFSQFRIDNNERRYLTAINRIIRRRAYVNYREGRLPQAISLMKAQIRRMEAIDTEENISMQNVWLKRYMRRFVLRGFVASLLESILDLGDLAIKGGGNLALSDQWYNVALKLINIDSEEVGGDLEDLKASALCHAINAAENEDAIKTIIDLKGDGFYRNYRYAFTSRYHEECAESADQQLILWILLQRCFSAVIWTSEFCDHLKRGDISNERTQRFDLAARWSEIAWIVTMDSLSFIPRELAARCLELSIWFRKENAGTWYNLGCEYLRTGKTDLALHAFAESIQLEESQFQKRYSYQSRIGIGRAQKNKQDLLAAHNTFKETSRDLIEYAKSEPEGAVNLLIDIAQNLKDLLYSQNDEETKRQIMAEVYEIYNQALAVSEEAQLALQEVLKEKTKWSEKWVKWSNERTMPIPSSIIAIMKKSLSDLLSMEASPERIETLHQKGFAFYRLKEYEKSNENIDKILRFEPTNVFVLINKAQNLCSLKRFDEALCWIDRALELDEKNARALLTKGQILGESSKEENETHRKEKVTASIEWFDLSLLTDRNYVPAWLSKADALYKLGGRENEEQAIYCYSKVLELEPKNLHAWWGEIHIKLWLIIQAANAQESDFKLFNELIKNAVATIDESNKDAFLSKARDGVLHSLRRAIFEGHISSQEELRSFLDKFEKNLGSTFDTPSLTEIVRCCERDRDFSKKGNELTRVLSLTDFKKSFDNCLDKVPNLVQSEKYCEALKCVNLMLDNIHSIMRLYMLKGQDEELGFTAFAELVKEALDKVDERYKDLCIARARKSAIHCFKKAIYEDCIDSREKLLLLLAEFDKKIDGLMPIPNETEILYSCKREKDFTRNRDKVARILGLQNPHLTDEY